MTPIEVQVDLSRYMVNEAVSNSSFTLAMETIKTYLKKNNIFTHDDMRDVTVGGTKVFYPKSFETKGSMIIITNRNAGQIDTAVRNRGLVCDLAFTVEECLGLIKDIMPAIMPGKLSSEAKIKALEYLQALASAKSKMEISIRSFTTVAKVYEDVDDESQAERMIREQMRLQSLRGGKRY